MYYFCTKIRLSERRRSLLILPSVRILYKNPIKREKKFAYSSEREDFIQKRIVMTTLYLTRHGETVDNANKIMQGQTQGMLNDNGIKQARELAAKLADKPIDVFVSSDLKRAVDTCRIVAEPHHADVKVTPLLRERDWGSFTGRYIPDLKDAVWTDDIETIDELKLRAGKFLEYVRREYKGKTVLVVGHGIINKAIQAVYYNKEMKDVPRMENAEVRVLKLK